MAQLAAAAPSLFTAGQPMPEMNARFEPSDGWIGADGDYSVSLTPERTLWLFSDTWVGHVRAGKRTDTVMVNNSLALQEGHGAETKVQFIVHHNDTGHPVAFITPADHHGWYWLQAGALVQDRLFPFLMQLEKTGAGGAFGFRQVGQWLGIVANPLDPPTTWRIEQHQLPNVQFSPEHQISYGAAALVDGGYLYIYGTEDQHQHGGIARHLLVARVPTNAVADFSAWRYYTGEKWDADCRRAVGIADGLATECSVSFLPQSGQYVLVYTEQGYSPKIQVRTAATPWGKWSAPTTVYHCPEMDLDKQVFCYAAKAHPSEASGDQLVITYAANSMDFWEVMTNTSLYWPRFVSVNVKTP
jgi:hypothetical protein